MIKAVPTLIAIIYLNFSVFLTLENIKVVAVWRKINTITIFSLSFYLDRQSCPEPLVWIWTIDEYRVRDGEIMLPLRSYEMWYFYSLKSPNCLAILGFVSLVLCYFSGFPSKEQQSIYGLTTWREYCCLLK